MHLVELFHFFSFKEGCTRRGSSTEEAQKILRKLRVYGTPTLARVRYQRRSRREETTRRDYCCSFLTRHRFSLYRVISTAQEGDQGVFVFLRGRVSLMTLVLAHSINPPLNLHPSCTKDKLLRDFSLNSDSGGRRDNACLLFYDDQEGSPKQHTNQTYHDGLTKRLMVRYGGKGGYDAIMFTTACTPPGRAAPYLAQNRP